MLAKCTTPHYWSASTNRAKNKSWHKQISTNAWVRCCHHGPPLHSHRAGSAHACPNGFESPAHGLPVGQVTVLVIEFMREPRNIISHKILHVWNRCIVCVCVCVLQLTCEGVLVGHLRGVALCTHIERPVMTSRPLFGDTSPVSPSSVETPAPDTNQEYPLSASRPRFDL